MFGGQLDFAGRQRVDMSVRHGRTERASISQPNTVRNVNSRRLVPATVSAMAAHQHHPVWPKRACQRGAFLGFDHQHIGVAELIALIPEGHIADDGGEIAGTSGLPEMQNSSTACEWWWHTALTSGRAL